MKRKIIITAEELEKTHKRQMKISAEAVQKNQRQYQELRSILEEVLASAIHNLTVQLPKFDITTN